jgi:hypothetical protein
MAKHFFVQFARDVTVEGRAHKAGDVVADAEIPAGSLASCLRLGHVVECEAPQQSEPSEPKIKTNRASQRVTQSKETVNDDR